MKFAQLPDSQEVENALQDREHTFVWAWIDEKKGLVRARTFAPDFGIPEDEANGPGSLELAAKLNRNLEIRHGKGSIIYAKPAENKFADLGGRAILDDSEQGSVKVSPCQLFNSLTECT